MIVYWYYQCVVWMFPSYTMDDIATIYFCKIYRTEIVGMAKQCQTHFYNVSASSALIWCHNQLECLNLKKLSKLIPTVKLYFGRKTKIINYLQNCLNAHVADWYSAYCGCVKLCNKTINKYNKSIIRTWTKQLQNKSISTNIIQPILRCSRGKITIFVCDKSQKEVLLSQILANNFENSLCIYSSSASINHEIIHSHLLEKNAVCLLLCHKYFQRLQLRYIKRYKNNSKLRMLNKAVEVKYLV